MYTSTRLLSLVASALVALGCGRASMNVDDAGNETESADAAVSMAPSGMGAIAYSGGTFFRVWAPDAVRAWVMGDFNNWSKTEMTRSAASGNFSVDVPNAAHGQRYKLAFETADGQEQVRADARSRQQVNSASDSVIYDGAVYKWKSPDFQTPAANAQVIYEMHIGTFHDAEGGKPGTWASAVEKLDHLKDLGVNMVELLPVFEFAGDWSWGYNPAFPFAPESIYGSPDEMKAFVDQAHARGIGVIFDVVHNHWGRGDLPHGKEYFYADGRRLTPWGDRPDYTRQPVRDYIADSARMLLGEYRGDGLRWDATKYMRTTDGDPANTLPEGESLLRDINAQVQRAFPKAIMIAEDFGAGERLTQPLSQGGFGFDSQWSGDFVHPIRAALLAATDGERSMVAVRNALESRSASSRVIYTESHDEVANGKTRVPAMVPGVVSTSVKAKKLSTLGAALVMTAPGIPMLFQGQELFEDEYFRDTQPLRWDRAQEFSGITLLYRDLIALRRNLNGVSGGLLGSHLEVLHVNDGAKVLAFQRWDKGAGSDNVVVVANFSGREWNNYVLGFPHPGEWKVRFNSDAARYDPAFGNVGGRSAVTEPGLRDGHPQKAAVSIGPYSVLVFSLGD